MPDSSLKIIECGGGMEISYTSGKELKGAELNKHINELVSLSKRVNPRLKKPYLKRLAQDLKDNQYLREALAKKLGVKGKIENNDTFFARGRGGEKIVFKDGFYRRTLSNGTYEKYDSNGKIVSMYDRNSNYLMFVYANNKLAQISDNNGRRLDFNYYNNGKVKEIKTPEKKMLKYAYDGQDLARALNAWNMTYQYSYDNLHNLVRVVFPDKTSKEISYNKDKDLVIGFKDRSDCSETYKYEGSKKDPRNHYWSTVEKKCNGKVTNSSRYEFWHRKKSDGTGKFLYRVLSQNNKDVVDVTYHDIFGKPLTVVENKRRTWYKYNRMGLVSEKRTPIEKNNYAYDKTCNKISFSSKEEYGDYKQIKKVTYKESTKFVYDKPKCNLIYAASSKGIKVKVGYDRYGRINKLIDQGQKFVKLSYDKVFGKPNYIVRPGLGAIKVTYDDKGEMKDVKSDEGAEVAAQVATVFNNLLQVVEPATSGLSI
jgi:YD repeat-containing protein